MGSGYETSVSRVFLLVSWAWLCQTVALLSKVVTVVTPLSGWTPDPSNLGWLDRGSIHSRVNGPPFKSSPICKDFALSHAHGRYNSNIMY